MNKKTEKRRELHAGFTLIEVLLVVAILGILAAVVVANFGGRQVEAMRNTARQSIKAIEMAIDLYEQDNGHYPQAMQNLVQSTGEPNWKGPYIRGGIPVDPWATPFGYTPKGDNAFEVRSAGPDRQMNTGDDITGWMTENK